MLTKETIYTLLTIKGWLMGIRESEGVGYYNYLNAIDRMVNNRLTDFDYKALENLRFELLRHWNNPRSQQEAHVLQSFVNGLSEALRINEFQLQTTS